MNTVPNSITPETLRAAGEVVDRSSFTKAGRAYQKHGSRRPSRWGSPVGNSEVINEIGQQHLDQIINSPDTQWTIRHHARFGEILEGRLPDGRGVRWSADGRTFHGFLED